MLKPFLLNFINLLSNALIIVLFARVILSFLPFGAGKVRLWIFSLTEPILAPIRKLVPPIGGAIDLSPIIFYLLLEVIIELANRLLV
jgi:YggT family protein